MAKKAANTQRPTNVNEDLVYEMLQAIGEDPEREGLRETPSRVAKSWKELFAGYGQDPVKMLKVFNEPCDEMVIVKDVEFYSNCEHHIQPFFGKAHVGYLPNNRVVGLSKIPRLIDIFARRLQIQERLGKQVAETLMDLVKPRGVGVVLEARHFCMTCRGVNKQNSVAMTSCMLGAFRKDHKVRSEFLAMIGK